MIKDSPNKPGCDRTNTTAKQEETRRERQRNQRVCGASAFAQRPFTKRVDACVMRCEFYMCRLSNRDASLELGVTGTFFDNPACTCKNSGTTPECPRGRPLTLEDQDDRCADCRISDSSRGIPRRDQHAREPADPCPSCAHPDDEPRRAYLAKCTLPKHGQRGAPPAGERIARRWGAVGADADAAKGVALLAEAEGASGRRSSRAVLSGGLGRARRRAAQLGALGGRRLA